MPRTLTHILPGSARTTKTNALQLVNNYVPFSFRHINNLAEIRCEC